MTNPYDYIITLPSGKLAATELPDDKNLLREVTNILVADYDGETTYGKFHLPDWSVNRGQTTEDQYEEDEED